MTAVDLTAPEPDALAAHLADRYGVAVSGVQTLDVGVFDVSRADGSRWVARAYPSRPAAAMAADAAVLRGLEQAGFPAERCARPDPLSQLGDVTVLVTDFVAPAPPLRPGRMAALLGALLGRLHAAPTDGLSPGGAWHHLAVGTPRDEVAAAAELVARAGGRGPRLAALQTAVADTDDGDGLPEAFVHPDFVAANALPTEDERLVVVDWTGAGRGPRLWSLGFSLYAAGAHSLRLVAPLLTRYRRHVALEAEEHARLAGAIRGRPVMLEAWSYAAGRRSLGAAVSRVERIEATAAAIAQEALQVLDAAP